MSVNWTLQLCASSLNQTGCGGTKGCLFKPTGCDPATDCTVGVVFTVTEEKWLDIEMTATAIEPTVDMQYIAIGFSRDAHMVRTTSYFFMAGHAGRVTRVRFRATTP